MVEIRRLIKGGSYQIVAVAIYESKFIIGHDTRHPIMKVSGKLKARLYHITASTVYITSLPVYSNGSKIFVKIASVVKGGGYHIFPCLIDVAPELSFLFFHQSSQEVAIISRKARASWSGQDVGLVPQHIPSRRSTTSSGRIPTTRLEMPCRLP